MFKGFLTTFKSIFEKPVTIQYPEEKRPVRTRFRGGMCSSATIMGWKSASVALCAPRLARQMPFSSRRLPIRMTERFSPGERYAKVYEINMLRCIFCGFCEDSCPTEAIIWRPVRVVVLRTGRHRSTPRKCCWSRSPKAANPLRRKHLRESIIVQYRR